MNKIKEIRTNLGLSQKDLAEKIGVTEATICRIERGTSKSPQFKTRREIAKALKVKVEELGFNGNNGAD